MESVTPVATVYLRLRKVFMRVYFVFLHSKTSNKAKFIMSKELRELHEAIKSYALEHSINEIPQLYYKKIVYTWHDMNKNGHDWDKFKAAAALLYVAVTDGTVHLSQITPQGYKALNWAENFHKENAAVAA
ncbi:hypothetical protein MNBD_GAMMA06-1390 [hydrothermal vent metagenome]|uniref:Uncharacterized protein n=1 Tax=hydrothermal vent metagenome TaxID=652676 RepID=A0A3B0X0F8_9ZZZZ